MTELLLYHGLCLTELIITYSDYRPKRKELSASLEAVYIMTALIIMSDCLYGVFSYLGINDPVLLYFVNIVYFMAEELGVYAWMCYTMKTLGTRAYRSPLIMALLSLPAAAAMILALTTPVTGFVFTIQDGEYVRGTLFFLDSAFKLFYIAFASADAIYNARRENRKYLKKRDMLLALFGVPIILAGILQTFFSMDFNCMSSVLALTIVYKFGLSNEEKEKGELVNALAQTYSAVFLINSDDHSVRTITASEDYSDIAGIADTTSYEDCVVTAVQKHVAPEDRIMVKRGFAIDTILNHLAGKNTYSLIYKLKIRSGQDVFNKATFMKAFNENDRREIFLGIEKLDTRQILLQKRENLSNEREEFERVKENFTSVIANIVEARDMNSGEHVLRVKNITEMLCNRVMEDYPTYGLDPVKIRYIVNGSALHDIGKIMIPDSILLKPGRLTREEFEIMKTHSEKGCVILSNLPDDLDTEYVKYTKEICRWHHEKFDGRGYPDGLVGNAIPISAQIVSMADCYDALTSERPYKRALPKDIACRMILEGQCGVFNPDLIDCFKKVFM